MTHLEKRPLVVRMSAISSPVSAEERSYLKTIDARVIEVENAGESDFIQAAPVADAVQIGGSYLPASVIRQLERCKVISRHGTGVDKIDVAQATRQGIIVANVPDFCTEEVADHTLALLLASVRQLKTYEAFMRKGDRPGAPLPLVRRLSALTCGVIGLGSIGLAVAKRARAFGMRILGYDNIPVQGIPDYIQVVDLDHLYRSSDIVSLHCPLTPESRNMIGMQQFRIMKPTAILVNTSRGEIVNEDDLAAALRDGIIGYAALDVFGAINCFGHKPFPIDHPIFDLENVLLTPHVAAHGPESFAENRRRGVQAVIDVLSGKWPQHVVNPEVTPWFPISCPDPDTDRYPGVSG
ncbi:MAG: C-terminal binding protein [Anaerolineales bacterium]|nr:C-terminal binding protein [Anaerolineales bacterium]